MLRKIGIMVMLVGGVLALGLIYADWRSTMTQVMAQKQQCVQTLESIQAQITQIKASVAKLSESDQSVKELMRTQAKRDDEQNTRLVRLQQQIEQSQASTFNQLELQTKRISAVEEKAKGWIKESLVTMKDFETELYGQGKDIEVLNSSKLPALENKISKITQQNEQLSTHLSIAPVEARMTTLEKRFEQVQEKVLDIILKQK